MPVIVNERSGKLILIVDDSADNQILLNTLLTSRGHQVYCAENGMSALCMLRELSVLPDLILLDAEMPVMDGYRFRLEQSTIARLRDIPVVVMTGFDHDDLDEKMLHPEGILPKPLNIDAVFAMIANFADQH